MNICCIIDIRTILNCNKVIVFLYHREDIVGLNKIQSKPHARDLQNKEDQLSMLGYFPRFSTLFYTLRATTGLTSLLASVLIPTLSLRHGKYLHACLHEYPFKYELGDFIYWIIRCIEVYAAYSVWSVTCGVDSIFGMYTLQMCGELRVLTRKFENLRSSSDYSNSLKECIERHRRLMLSRDMLQNLFGLLSIWVAVTSAIILCMLIFQAIEVILC